MTKIKDKEIEKENQILRLKLKHSNILADYCMSKIRVTPQLNYIQKLCRKRDQEIIDELKEKK
jgi:hypothetical protein